jgi:hypothetical protein
MRMPVLATIATALTGAAHAAARGEKARRADDSSGSPHVTAVSLAFSDLTHAPDDISAKDKE